MTPFNLQSPRYTVAFVIVKGEIPSSNFSPRKRRRQSHESQQMLLAISQPKDVCKKLNLNKSDRKHTSPLKVSSLYIHKTSLL